MKSFEEILKSFPYFNDDGVTHIFKDDAIDAFKQWQQQFAGKYWEEVEIKSEDDLPKENNDYFVIYNSIKATRRFSYGQFSTDNDEIITHWLNPIKLPIQYTSKLNQFLIELAQVKSANPQQIELLLWRGDELLKEEKLPVGNVDWDKLENEFKRYYDHFSNIPIEAEVFEWFKQKLNTNASI